MAHGFSCSLACGILSAQGSYWCLLHWQVDSTPLSHQGSPKLFSFRVFDLQKNFKGTTKCSCVTHPVFPVNILDFLNIFFYSRILLRVHFVWPSGQAKKISSNWNLGDFKCHGFSGSHVWMWEFDYKESRVLKNWCFWTAVLEKTLESPLDWKEIQSVHPKGN